ncbi:MAG: DNA recombination protein RmuC [Bacteroidetes bacterium]|nr:DNA recombination protein RmuC [Bacteroidota bacterium]
MATIIISTIILALMILGTFLLLKAKLNSTDPKEFLQKIFSIDQRLQDVKSDLKKDFKDNRQEFNKIAKDNRFEQSRSIYDFTETITKEIEKLSRLVDKDLKALQQDNNQQLEKMRETVDEKLQKTLESRISQSFKLVSDRLEKVHQGLGEMQVLASGVGDLKKVLSNVKTKGILGEHQLGAILEAILSPTQYEENVETKKNSNLRVEFAIKLPNKAGASKHIWLPIDSKFPSEPYKNLLEAYEEGNKKTLASAQKAFYKAIESHAKIIATKYIDPPHTTNFGVLFLPVEGMYAEVIRLPELFDKLQRSYKIMVAGPSNMGALLNSLQMGFRTLAIQKQASEVWDIVSAVKTEFGKFASSIQHAKKKIQQAESALDKVDTRTRVMDRKLKGVEELPEAKADKLLELSGSTDIKDIDLSVELPENIK